MTTQNSGGEPVTPKLDENGNPIPGSNEGDGNGPTGDDQEFDADGNLITSGDSDPLDVIEDEQLRAELKRDRAIRRRLFKQGKIDADGNPIEQSNAPVATPEPANPAATKDDLKLMTLNAARKAVPQEVQDVWDDLKTVPLGGFDPLDVDSVATNMIKRYNLYRMDNPADPENPAAPLSTSPRIPTGGGGHKQPPASGEKKELPGYKEPVQPEDWYPAPEGK